LTKGKLVSSNLKKLVLTGNPLGDVGATHLALFLRQQQNLPHLEELDLTDCRIGQLGAQSIAEALLVKRELKTLKIINNPVQGGLGDIIKNLAYNPSITELDTSKVHGLFNDQGRDTLAKLLQLSVTIQKINLWKVPNLNSLSNTVFDELEKNKSLKILDMGDTQFNNLQQLGKALHKNTTLEEINLQNNDINSTMLFNMYEELKKEKGAFSIRKFHLSGNQLDIVIQGKEKHWKTMGQLLQMATNLTYLDLSNCQLHKEHMVTIGEALKPEYKIPLETLLLRKNNIGKYGLKPLSQGLKQNTALKVLDLSGNDLGVLGANSVASMLLENKGLQELNLFGNFIEIEGAIMIAEALGVNTTLKRLDMGLNRIRVRGALAVAQVLAKNTTLERLALKHNHITDKAGMAIASAIVGNTGSALRYIALAGNYLSVPARSEIAVLFNQCEAFKQRNFEFDIAKLVEVKDPEKQERTIYVTPLPMNVTEQQIKKLFYSNKCGVCLNVSIHSHKNRSVFSKAKYAFVEFAHPLSTELASRLVHSKKNIIGANQVRIVRAGIQNKHGDNEKKQEKPAREPRASRGRTFPRGNRREEILTRGREEILTRGRGEIFTRGRGEIFTRGRGGPRRVY
jgi:Ran GTPase-activating protein (RanGAP) involved in mRNA processing and transport